MTKWLPPTSNIARVICYKTYTIYKDKVDVGDYYIQGLSRRGIMYTI